MASLVPAAAAGASQPSLAQYLTDHMNNPETQILATTREAVQSFSAHVIPGFSSLVETAVSEILSKPSESGKKTVVGRTVKASELVEMDAKLVLAAMDQFKNLPLGERLLYAHQGIIDAMSHATDAYFAAFPRIAQ